MCRSTSSGSSIRTQSLISLRKLGSSCIASPRTMSSYWLTKLKVMVDLAFPWRLYLSAAMWRNRHGSVTFAIEMSLSTIRTSHSCRSGHSSLCHVQRRVDIWSSSCRKGRGHISWQSNHIRYNRHLISSIEWPLSCVGWPTIWNPWSANSLAWSPDVAYIPLLMLFSFATRCTFAIASLSSSCMVPSRMGCPMLLPKSKGPTKRTSIPGTLAISWIYKSSQHSTLRPCASTFVKGHTLCNASLVSICTIVTRLSFACCRYSVDVWPPKFSIGNGFSVNTHFFYNVTSLKIYLLSRSLAGQWEGT